MDYKQNVLNFNVECEDQIFKDIPILKFGKLPNDKIVFDVTEYCLGNKMEELDYRTFSRVNKRYVEYVISDSLKRDELFFKDKRGHSLFAQELLFIFLSFVDKDLFIYFNQMLMDVMVGGVAFSDGFAFQLAIERLPSDVLTEIINTRNEEGS